MLLEKFPYQRLEELRRNCTVHKYPGKTGKSEVAIDECVELVNRFFVQFPKVRTLEAFTRQSNYIGLAIMCKRFVVAITTFADKEDQVFRR